MNKLVEAVKKTQANKKTVTENGMKARVSTANSNLDLFFKIGASRGKDILPLFNQAYTENKEYALRIAMWTRDIRSGAGERQLYLDIVKHLELVNYTDAIILIDKIKELGRFKDLFSINYENMHVQNHVFEIVKKAIFDEKNALAAKWTPRKGVMANRFRKFLNLKPKDYRQQLAELSNTVEQKMSANKWNEINYNHTPSLTMSRNKKAFKKHDEDRFNLYKTALQDGTAKVNAAALYPYDVLKALENDHDEIIAKSQWDALPNYLGEQNILPMVDVSGSMSQQVHGTKLNIMNVAISLGLYIADKSKGSLRNTLLTFTDTPYLFALNDNQSLSQKVKLITKDVGYSTNLEQAFNTLLTFAKNNNVPVKDMPEYLLVISDMQFNDSSINGKSVSAFNMIKNEYEKSGYIMPKLVFWNMAAKDNVPVKFNKDGVALISGFSPSIMKSVLAAKEFNPMDVMLETIMNERYSL